MKNFVAIFTYKFSNCWKVCSSMISMPKFCAFVSLLPASVPATTRLTDLDTDAEISPPFCSMSLAA